MTQLKSKEGVELWLKVYKVQNYYINECFNNLTVDVYGDVDLSFLEIDILPIQFDTITGDFNISYNHLASLKGCPQYVNGKFSCGDNVLTSLEYFPKEVGSNVDVSHNLLKSLDGITSQINGHLIASSNQLTTLKNGPIKIDGTANFLNNRLENIEGIARYINGDLYLAYNHLKTIKSLIPMLEIQVFKTVNIDNDILKHIEINKDWQKPNWLLLTFDDLKKIVLNEKLTSEINNNNTTAKKIKL